MSTWREGRGSLPRRYSHGVVEPLGGWMGGFLWVLETISPCTGLSPCLTLGPEGASTGEGWGAGKGNSINVVYFFVSLGGKPHRPSKGRSWDPRIFFLMGLPHGVKNLAGASDLCLEVWKF